MAIAQNQLEPEEFYCTSDDKEGPLSTSAVLSDTKSIAKNDPIGMDDLDRILGSTVKHDNATKIITFLGMLLTYTEEDQINIGFLAESATGKSYIPLELSKYFPEEDIKRVGYASPTAFFHDYIIQSKTAKSKQRTRTVDLHQKILIFVDQPHDLLLQRLRPILSHDKKVIELLITDRTKNKNLRTNHIDIKGYPTVIFSSAKFQMSNQEKTRLLLLSPETTQTKLHDSIELKIKKESDRKAYNFTLDTDAERTLLKQRVLEVKNAQIKYIVISETLAKTITDRFFKKHEKLLPRNQRDISRLLSMIKANALLNFKFREKNDESILVNEEDVNVGFELYETVSEANELGLSPELYRIYVLLKAYIEKHATEYPNGISINDYQIFYKEEFYRIPNYDTARDTLKSLVSLNLLIEEQDIFDRRIKKYMLPECVQKTEKSTQW